MLQGWEAWGTITLMEWVMRELLGPLDERQGGLTTDPGAEGPAQG